MRKVNRIFAKTNAAENERGKLEAAKKANAAEKKVEAE